MPSPELFFETCRDLCARAVELADDDANEAATRLEVVDGILENVLGWPRADFQPEHSTESGSFTDYLLRSHRSPLVIVEAKRAGKTFNLPAKYRKREYGAGSLCSYGGPELKAAMTQAAEYCNQTAAQFAVVTNGRQWIVFRGLARRDRGWGAFPAIVFSNPALNPEVFVEFWSLLSKERVLQGSLTARFRDEVLPPPEFVKVPNANLRASVTAPAREDVEEIAVLLEHYFDEIIQRDHGDMLTHCFVDDPDHHEYGRRLQGLLKEQLFALTSEDADKGAEHITADELTKAKFRKMVDTLSVEDRARIVLIVGRVGAGKTTFLHWFFKELETESGYVRFILDLLPDAQAAVTPREDEVQRLSRKILEAVSDRYHDRANFGQEFDPYALSTLRTIYSSAVRRLRDGPMQLIYARDPGQFEIDLAAELQERSKDAADLLPKYMRYIAARTNRPFCLVIDNVDRATHQYQKFVYGFAKTIATQIPGVITISMRDTTYSRAREEGFLDTTINDTVFQLNPPNLKTVISRRIKYLSRQAKDPSGTPRRLRPLLASAEGRIDYLRKLLLVEDDTARLLITCLANRSVRRALYLLRQYAQSPWAWAPYPAGGAGNAVLRALMCGRSYIYRSAESSVENIFSVPTDIRGSHFMAVTLLAYLDWCSESGKKASSIGDIVEDMGSWGHPQGLVMSTLERIVRLGLVESDNRFIALPEEGPVRPSRADLDYGDRIRLSPAGYFYLHELSRNPVYRAFVAGDTAWYSKDRYQAYFDNYSSAVDLMRSAGRSTEELVSDCVEPWLDYLRDERTRENEVLASSAGVAWRSAVMSRLDTVVQASPRASTVPRPRDPPPLRVASPQQIDLFSPSETQMVRLSQGMPPLSDGLMYNDNHYVPRVLWALELARRAGVGPIQPRRIAEYVTLLGHVKIFHTNTARFFRDCRSDEALRRYQSLWIESGTDRRRLYQISPDGLAMFATIFPEPADQETEEIVRPIR